MYADGDTAAGSQMRSVRLGTSGIILSTLGFGTAGLLRIPQARRRQDVLAAALATGITHFDTAPIYGLGESERALGRFVRGRRAHVSITTKFGLSLKRSTVDLAILQSGARRVLRVLPGLRAVAGRAGRSLYRAPDFTLGAVRTSLENSLRALHTDYVDLFLAHECSAESLPSMAVLEFLAREQKAGKIREFGVASTFERTCAVAAVLPQLARVCQFESDLFEPNAQRFPQGPQRAFITYGALTSALPRMASLSRDPAAIVSRWSQQHGIDLQDWGANGALLLRAAVLSNPQGCVLMQSTSTAHIERNARAADCNSRDQAIRSLVGLIHEAQPL